MKIDTLYVAWDVGMLQEWVGDMRVLCVEIAVL
jgi:hypothetical protein